METKFSYLPNSTNNPKSIKSHCGFPEQKIRSVIGFEFNIEK